MVSKIINFLEKAKIKYQSIRHRTVYTAQDKAATLKVKENLIGKTLVVKLDKDPALVLISANKNLDKQKLKKVAKAKKVDFLTETWMKKNLKGVKVGAIPPFGNLWKIKTYVDRSLINLPKIIVSGGDYNFSIQLSPSSLKKLVPDLLVGSFSKTKK